MNDFIIGEVAAGTRHTESAIRCCETENAAVISS
jgi:hypothetical protein